MFRSPAPPSSPAAAAVRRPGPPSGVGAGGGAAPAAARGAASLPAEAASLPAEAASLPAEAASLPAGGASQEPPERAPLDRPVEADAAQQLGDQGPDEPCQEVPDDQNHDEGQRLRQEQKHGPPHVAQPATQVAHLHSPPRLL
jgi:hypothetical protein